MVDIHPPCRGKAEGLRYLEETLDPYANVSPHARPAPAPLGGDGGISDGGIDAGARDDGGGGGGCGCRVAPEPPEPGVSLFLIGLMLWAVRRRR